MARTILKTKWNIICPSTCYCYHIPSYLDEIESLDSEILSDASTRNVERALRKVKKLLKIYDDHNYDYITRKRTLYDGFQIGIMKRKFISEGIRYLQEAYDLSVFHGSEKSDEALKYKKYLDNPNLHRNYLICE
jgi:hypothetical protein